MATTNQIKFYRLSATAMSSKTVSTGAIWFNTDDKTIQIKTATGWDKYAGKLNDAQWDANKQKLTISKYDGSSIELDFSDIASGSSVKAALDALETKLQDNIDAANTSASNAQAAADAAQADVDAVEEKLGDGFSKDSTVAAQLAAVKATADAAAVRDTVNAALELKADKTQVATDIATAKSGAEATAAADATAKANAAQSAAIDEATRLDGVTNQRIDALDAAYKKADEEILGQIEEIVAGAISVEAAEGDKYVSVTPDGTKYVVSSKGIDAAIKVETDRATAAEAGLQGAIDVEKGRIDTLVGNVEGDDALSAREIVQDEVAKQLTSESISESFDTLKEMAEWLSAHPEDVNEMNSDISKNSTDIANETAARVAADQEHAAAIAALEQADAAQDALIAKKADQEALDDTNDAVALNTEAVADHKTRIEALEGTANALGTTYVKVSDYSTDKAAFEQKHTDLQDEIDAAEDRLDVVEGDITTIKGEQTTQNSAIEAAAALGQQGIDDAAAALGEAQAKVKSVTGDADVNASTTDHAVSLSLNKATSVAEGDTKAVTSGAVYDALCWVEFE